jgi:hypothetical protein
MDQFFGGLIQLQESSWMKELDSLAPAQKFYTSQNFLF